MQALEGPEKDVLALYAKIERDVKHTESIRILQKQIQERKFGEWAMSVLRF